jgi:hypothetical protein
MSPIKQKAQWKHRAFFAWTDHVVVALTLCTNGTVCRAAMMALDTSVSHRSYLLRVCLYIRCAFGGGRIALYGFFCRRSLSGDF